MVRQLNLTGYLKPNVDTYHILYNFSEVDYKYKEQISFEKIVSGTFNICGQVLDASKIIGFDYSYSDIDLTLTIKLDTSKWDFRLKKESLFSYQLNVDDASSTSTCPSSVSPSTYCTSITPSDYSAINTSSTTSVTLKNGDKLSYTDTFTGTINNSPITIYGIYMDFTQPTGSSYFTISSLYINSCTGGAVICTPYDDISYLNSSGVSGIMIPSEASDGYVPTTITISSLMSIVIYVNSSSEYYYFGVPCSSATCTAITPSDYNTEISTNSSSPSSLSKPSYYYSYNCQYNESFLGTDYSGTVYTAYFTLAPNSTTTPTHYTISTLYILTCCSSGCSANGTIYCESDLNSNTGVTVKYSNTDSVNGIVEGKTVVDLTYTYSTLLDNTITIEKTFGTFYISDTDTDTGYTIYACMNTDFCLSSSSSTSCSSSSSS